MPLLLIPAIQRASHAIAAFLDAEELDITQSEAHILAHLAAQGSQSVGQIYMAFGHKRSTLTSILNRLEDRSFVTCTVNETDKRSFLIGLTPSGEALAHSVYEKLKDLEDEILGALPPKDQNAALGLLTAITTLTSERRPPT